MDCLTCGEKMLGVSYTQEGSIESHFCMRCGKEVRTP